MVEIAFDVIHRSTRHASGFAMRFPRIVRIRDDKTAAEVDRLSTVAALHDRLQVGGRAGVLTIGEGRAVGEGGGIGDGSSLVEGQARRSSDGDLACAMMRRWGWHAA